ncbi:MAG: class I SAM-dependent methyltransferase [Myxococcota bacterium]
MGRKQKQKQKRRKARASGPSQARQADLYALYEESVQDPEADIDLVDRVYKGLFGRPPRTFREDFCGTAATAVEFVRRRKDNRAWGVDLDPEPLAYGTEHHLGKLDEDPRSRITLIQGDVLDVEHGPVESIVAFNFSYFIFKERSQLLGYFEKSRARLEDEGIFVIDLYGGADAQRTLTETREHDDFDYVWDQDVFDPIQGRAVNYIHFEFPDGSRLDKAFTYDWRLWSIPELMDLLREAGFSQVDAYWEQTDKKTGEGNGVYYKATQALDDPAYVSYIVAVR